MEHAPELTSAWDEVAESCDFHAPVDWQALTARLPTSARLLDLGCAYGRNMLALHERSYRNVRGYDASAALLARGRAAAPDLDLCEADASALPEATGSFDGAIAAALFTTVVDPRQQRAIAAEIARVLRPGGWLFGVDFLCQDQNAYLPGGRFRASNGIEMMHFHAPELAGLFAGWPEWEAREVNARSLSGKPARALQYRARRPE